MSSDKAFSVSDDTKALVNDIIKQNNWDPVLDVKYSPGSQVGDGFASKHIAVEVVTSEKTIRLFVKYALNTETSSFESVAKFYANETYFYEITYPAYSKFLTEKNVQDVFRNAPKCYGTSSKYIIALEDLKYKGFCLFDRKKIMDEKHIALVMKTLAKFHATSFAFKDQNREEYDKLVENCAGDLFSQQTKDSPTIKMFYETIADTLGKLDPEEDKQILEKCIPDDLGEALTSAIRNLNEYSVITQGDCWCNNIMFQYEGGDNTNPIDIMVVDWQLLRTSSVVYDISYFFYTIAAEEALGRLQHYLELYYMELSNEIKKLGSDPTILYPKEVFEKEWKSFCKYGFAVAVVILKFMLANQDELPGADKMDHEKAKQVEKIEIFKKFDNEECYMKRFKTLARFMINNDYI